MKNINLNVELLSEAIEVLKQVQKEKKAFNYNAWGHRKKSHSCHTVACAGGYLALHKPFQKLGLKPKSTKNLIPTLVVDTCLYEGTNALKFFFGLGHDIAYIAFSALDVLLKKNKIKAKNVAKYLEQQIKDYRKKR